MSSVENLRCPNPDVRRLLIQQPLTCNMPSSRGRAPGGLQTRNASTGSSKHTALNLYFTQTQGPAPNTSKNATKSTHTRSKSQTQIHNPKTQIRSHTPPAPKKRSKSVTAQEEEDASEWVSSESGAATPVYAQDQASDDEGESTEGEEENTLGLKTRLVQPGPGTPRAAGQVPLHSYAVAQPPPAPMPEPVPIASRALTPPPEPIHEPTSAPGPAVPRPPSTTSKRLSHTRPPSITSISSTHTAMRPHPLIRGQSAVHVQNVQTPQAMSMSIAPMTAAVAPPVATEKQQAGPSVLSVSPTEEPASPMSRKTTRSSPQSSPTSQHTKPRDRTVSALSSAAALSSLTSLAAQNQAAQNHRSSWHFGALNLSTPAPSRPTTPPVMTVHFSREANPGNNGITPHSQCPSPYHAIHMSVLEWENPLLEGYRRVSAMRAQAQAQQQHAGRHVR
ncbi:hypothetical protein SISSUDRAFT_286681 [Sistotremastrum suecicum HHB10207 ss-3]|uniref:Uncharacterized protein n=1 Tax=Sistotremastrum suecicum HHB10207 ss-3 TaxID=1314776 RepID=A0A166GBQ3_9AGAM|nr:hypothetical protein SISSUDRAFT_286681 [Sistotremastrum suecicum HHB10207 ss-3]